MTYTDKAARDGVAQDAALADAKTEDGNSSPAKGSGLQSYVRVFSYGQTKDYLLLSIGLVASAGSGVALAMVNLVIGKFISVMADFTAGGSPPSNFMSDVSKYSLYFVYIGIGRFILIYVYSSVLTYAALSITRNIRHAYLAAALRQPVSFFDHGAGGSISMQATTNGKLIQSGTSEKLGQVFQAVSTFAAAIVIALVSCWKLTLIVLCIVPALLIVVSIASAFDARIETDILKTHAQAGAFAETALASIRTIHAFNLGDRMAQTYSEFLQRARALGNKKNALYGLMYGGEYFVVFAGMGLAFWQGIGMLASGQVAEIGTIFTVLFCVIISAAMINSIAPHMVTFSRAASAAAELFALIDRQSDMDPFDKHGDKPLYTSGEIRLDAISFSYPTRPDASVLRDFSLIVPAGKITALVGASGSGKSTIIGLIERWYNPNSGTIVLDGKDIRDLNLKWLRTNIRLVQQEPVLFNGTVFDNICNGLIGTEWEFEPYKLQLERVEAAAKTAFAHDFIQSLAQGYNTRIGERGGLLSGGQKQRIAIARSIISQPKILLLDEATSALDPQAEGIVQEALDEASKDRTTIIIAHKLKTIQAADNIVVMKQGTIVEQGRHHDLVSLGGAYAKLVKAQDLSPQKSVSSGPSETSDKEDEVALEAGAVTREKTAETDAVRPLKDREDYALHHGTGVFVTVLKLARATPENKCCYILTLLICLVGAGVYPGQTLLLGQVLDLLKSPNMQSRGNFISLMFFVMALGIGVVYAISGWTTNIIAQTFSQKIRSEMFKALMRQDLCFFDRPENTVGSLTSRIDSHAQSVFELMGLNIAIIVISMASVVASSIMSIYYSWKLGLVGVLAGLPPMLLAGYARIRVETNMDSEINKKFSKSASIASETVTAIRTVSSLAIEEHVLHRYTAELDTAISESRRSLFTMMIWFAFTQSAEYFVLALGFWWGSKLVFQGQITLVQFFNSFMAVYFSGQGAGQMFSFASSFTKANSAANYFLWLKNLEPTIQQTGQNKRRGPDHGCSSFGFEKVAFSYPLAPDTRVLKGISLKIDPGQFVAFVGASGCGKSTMISLLERFYDPSSGTIVVDGCQPMRDLNPRLYRGLVSLVQQEPTLFPASIRENIAMGVDKGVDGHEVDDKTIEAACRAANAWDFISSLPDGLATPCGTSGSQLSGGQKQRIAIARALVRNPGVILLDEATSALDTESERVVQAALMDAASTGSRITIAVAHRLSTVRHADRIFVFFGGRIVEAGSHNELITRGGMYKKMCEAQSLDSTA